LRLLSSAILRIFSLTRARESVGPAKFLIAGEQAEHRGLPGIRGPAQTALRLSPLTRRSQIVSGPLFGRWHGYGLGANRRFRQKSNDFNAM
jgi:hypothetical protein